MLMLRQVRTVTSDCIKLVMIVREVAMVTVRVEEIMVVEVIVVAMAECLGSRQLSLVIWKMLPTAIHITKALSMGSQPTLRAVL